MPNETLEKLKHDKYVAERKLTAVTHKEKRLESELKCLTRSERTHRLCTRAGMLEAFLKEPTLLTDDDVIELLTFIFHGEAVQRKLALLIERRRNEAEQDSPFLESPCKLILKDKARRYLFRCYTTKLSLRAISRPFFFAFFSVILVASAALHYSLFCIFRIKHI